ncbi:MAG: DUF4113 domain-containing protein [Cyanobacteria bacterium J06631_2]
MFLQSYSSEKQQRLIETIDRLNGTMGRNTVFWGASGTSKSWLAKRDNVTPRYTTSWSELPIVKASLPKLSVLDL